MLRCICRVIFSLLAQARRLCACAIISGCKLEEPRGRFLIGVHLGMGRHEGCNFCDDTSSSVDPAFGARVSLAFECLDFHVCVFPIFQLQHEKAELEQHLEQEQEFQVNKLMKKIKKLENDTISKQLTLEQVKMYIVLSIYFFLLLSACSFRPADTLSNVSEKYFSAVSSHSGDFISEVSIDRAA